MNTLISTLRAFAVVVPGLLATAAQADEAAYQQMKARLVELQPDIDKIDAMTKTIDHQIDILEANPRNDMACLAVLTNAMAILLPMDNSVHTIAQIVQDYPTIEPALTSVQSDELFKMIDYDLDTHFKAFTATGRLEQKPGGCGEKE